METIHRIQENFRRLLMAMSYPGELKELVMAPNYEVLTDQNQELPCPAAYAILEIVADQEVAIMTLPMSPELEAELVIYTNVRKATAIKDVNYLYVSEAYLSDDSHLKELEDLSKGQLEDPEQSATLIIEVESLKATDLNYQIEGPGIDGTKSLYLPLSDNVLEWRSQMNREFPLGIDLILVDQTGFCMALPRTTRTIDIGRD